ncbi:hypothetical protein [Staphylococcus aureus]
MYKLKKILGIDDDKED